MNKIKKHLSGYSHGLKGIALSFRLEPAMRFHAVTTLAVILLNFVLHISRTEWLITLMLIGLVWMAEIFNTAIEKLSDRVTSDHDVLIGQVKDLASGAVCIICLLAVICSLVIYLPYLI